MQTTQQCQAINRLTATGRNGIITLLKDQAEKNPTEKPQEISGRGLNDKRYDIELDQRLKRITSLILRGDTKNKIMAHKMRHRTEAQIICTGVYTNGEISTFHIDLEDIGRRMTYRKLLIEYLTEALNHSKSFKRAIFNEAKLGGEYENKELMYEMLWIEKDMRNAGVTDEETIRQQIEPLQDKYSDQVSLHRSRLENICYFLLYDKQGNRERSRLMRDKLRLLTNSNLETLIGLYCNAYNEEHKEELQMQAKQANRDKMAERRKATYTLKKTMSAAQKRHQCQKFKTEGYTQKQTAVELGCTEKTVRNYW
jgi:hypothetical protein